MPGVVVVVELGDVVVVVGFVVVVVGLVVVVVGEAVEVAVKFWIITAVLSP
jgi:hypothetical protein